MTIQTYNPVTPSMRSLIQVDRSDLWKGEPYRPLVEGQKRTGGRNNLGRTTVNHRGGGHKQRYRIIDFTRNNELSATVQRLEYDPNRTAFLALLTDAENKYSYIIAPHNLFPGDTVVASGSGKNTVDIRTGNALPLSEIPIGTMVHNIEMKPGKGGQIVRSAGTYAQLIKKDDNGYCMLRLPSGEHRLFSGLCKATIGIVSNLDNKNRSLGKAGRTRWMGIKPTVRGVAMNPVDHPHGGGEGRTSGGRPSVTPWGWPTKGQPTRSVRKQNKFIVQTIKKRKQRA
jgi:large subunit ribosomal protein L2